MEGMGEEMQEKNRRRDARRFVMILVVLARRYRCRHLPAQCWPPPPPPTTPHPSRPGVRYGAMLKQRP